MEEKIEELSAEILLVPSFTERSKNVQGNEHFCLFIDYPLCKRVIWCAFQHQLIYVIIFYKKYFINSIL